MNGISKSFSKFYYYIMLNNNILSFADGKNIKAVFFDMDGVLFDSMPYHAQAWQRALSERGLPFSLYDAYLHEGRTADSTIDEAFIRAYGHTADRRTKDEIYSTKTDYFHQYPEPPQIPAVADVLRYVRSKNRQILVVTGSAQLNTDEVAAKIAVLRQHIKLPIGVGFGISDAESAAKIAAVADAVIVGSRIVKEVETHQGNEAQAVGALVRELKAAI